MKKADDLLCFGNKIRFIAKVIPTISAPPPAWLTASGGFKLSSD